MSDKFSCFLIGEGSLLLQCGEILLKKGHKILGIFAASRVIGDWANEKGINLYDPDSNIEYVLESQQFDYLFSIANLAILNPRIINTPLKMAINFHDGPLPRYAGINATSWALINNEKTYGITWHRITSGIDEGAILSQTTFDIAPDETAFTLNAKCYESGTASFNKLIADLESGTYLVCDQDFNNKTYFAKYQKPGSAGIISWKNSAENISALVRALNFGHYQNPLASAKMLIHNTPVIVNGVRIVESGKHEKPGILIDFNKDSITVSTATENVSLYDFETISGNRLSVDEILSKFSLVKGSSLEEPDEILREKLTDYYSEICKNESFFIERLKHFEPADIPFRNSNRKPGSKGTIEVQLDQKVREFIVSKTQFEYESFIKTAFALFVGRLQGKNSYDIGYTPHHESTPFNFLFAAAVPLHMDIDYSGKVSEQVFRAVQSFNKIRKSKTYLYDLIARTPELKGSGIDYSRFFVQINDGNITASASSLNSKLIFFYSHEHDSFHLLFDENEMENYSIHRFIRQFNVFLLNLIRNYNDDFYKVSALDDEEWHTLIHTWNKTQTDYNQNICIHELFEEQVKINPDAIAVVCDDQQITFDELNRKSDELANYLLSAGIRENNFVGISLNRSINMLVAILGIFKSGAAYVPLDPYFPKDRLTFMIEDSGCSLIITESAFRNNFESSKADLFYIDIDWKKVYSRIHVESLKPNSNCSAYLIYTSGSTGKPKGVIVTHKNVVNFFTGMDEHIKFNDSSSWLAVTSLSFDISVLELLWTLTRGLKVVLYTGEDLKVSPSKNYPASSSDKIDFSLFYFSSYEGEKSENKYKLLIEGARFGDKNGFAAVWTPERHFYDFGGLYANPSVTSAAISTITERIKIRAGSVVSPLHSTIRIAEEWSMVDNLSQGRVAIAFAAGWQPNDFVIMPQNFEDRKNIMFRQVNEIQKLWQGQMVSFQNPNGKMIDIQILPKPVQKKLPVWITAAGNPETFEMAGKEGYNLLTHLLGQKISEVAEKIKIYRDAWKKAGHKGEGVITLMLHTFVGTDEKSVKETVREPMKNYLHSAVNLVKEAAWSFPTFKQATTNSDGNFSMDQLSAEDLDAVLDYSFERYYQNSGLFGTPETCLKIVDDLKQIGVDEIACLIDFGIDSDLVLAHLHYLNQLRIQANKNRIKAENGHDSIGSLINKHSITHMQCTPSMAQMLLLDEKSKESLKSLQTLLIGGESFPLKLAENLIDSVSGDLLNMYGPTETTVWSTVYKLKKPLGRTIPIGKPIANTGVFVLDNYKQPLPAGIPGELYIGGDGVTEGYYKRDELTAEKFVKNPFSGNPDDRIYRTSDLACYNSDGNIEFLGRVDHQVKIRGYRIELEEIEIVLSSHPDIRDAAVIAHHDNSGDAKLAAYIIPKQKKNIDTSEIKSFLKSKLPEFMIPSHFITLDAFPLTPNGKINRKAFHAPESEFAVISGSDFVSPSDHTEKKIAEIWQDLLKLPRLGTNDNFFDLGGHSLLAVQLHVKLKETINTELTLIDVFTYPTIKSLAEFVKRKMNSGSEPAASKSSKRAEMSKQRISSLKSRNRDKSGDKDS